MEIKAGNIRKGMYVMFKNDPCLVTSTSFMSPGKGSAFMRAKFRSVRTGNTVEFNYKSTENLEQLDVSSQQMQFLYMDGQDVVLMDPRTYDQVSIPVGLLDGKELLLTAEVTVYVMFYNELPIGINFPPKVKLAVVEAQDAAAGNTVGQAKKSVTLETGLVVYAPLFVKTGDTLIIDTETKSYVSRG